MIKVRFSVLSNKLNRMVMKAKITTVLNKHILGLFLVVFFSSATMVGQTISTPTLGLPGNPIPKLCANIGTVPFKSRVSVNGVFPAGNQFRLLLSDANGSFASPTILQTISIASPGNGDFDCLIPIGTAGAGYRFRVVSTVAPIVQSGTTGPISLYYQPFMKPFSLNSGIADASICGGGSFTLSVDGPANSPNSPLSITPALKYRWYKDGIVVPGQDGPTLNITSSGVYRAFIEYGDCVSEDEIFKSQFVTVSIVPAGSTFTITSSQGTSFCPSTPTVLSTSPGYNYQWFRDGNPIAGATANSYSTGTAGSYFVQVGQGSCSSNSNIINLTPTTFNASIDVVQLPQDNIITEGETKTITVTTDAQNPEFRWFKNGIEDLTQTTNEYTTNEVGDYKVIIKQTTGCIATREFLFRLVEGIVVLKIPNIVSPNADEINDYWAIPQEYLSANTEVTIIDSYGKIALQTKSYQNNWPETPLEFKSVNPVYYYIIKKEGGETKKGSITIIK